MVKDQSATSQKTDNVDLRVLIDEILKNARELTLATADNNNPWAAALVFGHDENLNIYWISSKETRHSKELEKNPNVAAVVDVQPTGGGQDKGLQIEGQAFLLKEEEILPAAREYFAKRDRFDLPKTLDEANEMTEGRSWYVLRPKRIYVIYSKLFGYGRREYVV